MLKIGLDVMGGDLAPDATIKGAILALKAIQKDTQIILIGPEGLIFDQLRKEACEVSYFKIIHASDIVNMKEYPVSVLQKKPNNSISVAYRNLKQRKIDVFASSGNSGAVMIGALNSIGLIDGMSRPCVGSTYPMQNGSSNTLLDVGINVDCRPEMLVQFAVLGSIYVSTAKGISNPRVALLNTGEEETKGGILHQQVYQLLESLEIIDFIGNIEARDFFDAKADVTVCDGFTGNIFLKQTEGFYKILKRNNIKNNYLDLLNFESYGGAPLLGVNGNVILGHGISGTEAIKNIILTAENVAQANLSEVISKKLIQLNGIKSSNNCNRRVCS